VYTATTPCQSLHGVGGTQAIQVY